MRRLPRNHSIDAPARYIVEALGRRLPEIDVAELGAVDDGGARLRDHGGRGVGGDDVLECWGQAARDQAVAGAELEEGGGWAMVVAEEGVVEGLGVGWAEGGIGGG